MTTRTTTSIPWNRPRRSGSAARRPGGSGWTDGDGKAKYHEHEQSDLGGVTSADPQVLAALCARYELDMRPDTVPELIERFGVRFPGESIPAGWPRGSTV